MRASQALITATLRAQPDHIAPDGSEIRLLPAMSGGGLCHCTLPAGQTSAPVRHRQVEEIWYVLEGEGELWRRSADEERIVAMGPGTGLTIPPHTAFQFRATGPHPLRILISTMPPWPGPEEAEAAPGKWPSGAGI